MCNSCNSWTNIGHFELHERGWSNRRIAKELGIHRDTVSRHLQLASKDASPAGLDGSKPAKAPPGSKPQDRTGRSACAPFREIIEAKLDKGLTAKRIHQDLVAEHGFASKYHSVRRFVRTLGQTTPLPVRRMECSSGKQAQVGYEIGVEVLFGERVAQLLVLAEGDLLSKLHPLAGGELGVESVVNEQPELRLGPSLEIRRMRIAPPRVGIVGQVIRHVGNVALHGMAFL